MSLWLSYDGDGFEELPEFEDLIRNAMMRRCFPEPDKVIHWGLMKLSCRCAFLQIYPPYPDEDLFGTIFANCDHCGGFMRTKPSAEDLWLYCMDSVEAAFIFIRSDITEEQMKEVEKFGKGSENIIYDVAVSFFRVSTDADI